MPSAHEGDVATGLGLPDKAPMAAAAPATGGKAESASGEEDKEGSEAPALLPAAQSKRRRLEEEKEVEEESRAPAVLPAAPSKKRRLQEMVVPNYIPLEQAQRSRVVHFPGLLLNSDLGEVRAYHGQALASGDPLETNPQNRQHHKKRCTFLHGSTAPDGGLVARAPRVLAKLVRAAVQAKELGGWGASAATAAAAAAVSAGAASGPLADIDVRRLNIRVVELWEYDVGGGLVDDLHYDAGSIVTIVCLVNERSDFTGGTFRTFEASGEHQEHHLERGDALVLLSHKYHNITPVLSGRRCTLVMELWQGGLTGWCR